MSILRRHSQYQHRNNAPYTRIRAGTILEKCIIDTITITHFFLIIDTTTITLKKIIVDTITNT